MNEVKYTKLKILAYTHNELTTLLAQRHCLDLKDYKDIHQSLIGLAEEWYTHTIADEYGDFEDQFYKAFMYFVKSPIMLKATIKFVDPETGDIRLYSCSKLTDEESV